MTASSRRLTARIPLPTRPRVVRVTVTALACTGAVLLGAPAASANPYDINGDRVADQYMFDADRDGFVDNWWTDVDNDGTIDEFVSDLNRDTLPDTWAVDRDHDFVWDQLLKDTNGDAYPDSLLPGYAYDTVWGPNSQSSRVAAGNHCLTPEGGLPVNVPMYGGCAWLQTLATNSGLGPKPFDVIADAVAAANPGPL